MQAVLPPRASLLGVRVSVTDYAWAARCVLEAARERRPLALTAVAVHAVIEAERDPAFGAVLDHMDIVTPDGQPVRWGLNLCAHAGLAERVYGPELMLRVCEAAAASELSVFLYGSTGETLERLRTRLERRFSGLRVAGVQASRFREATRAEQEADARRIVDSGAHITFVGLGCPRQEFWVFHQRERLSMPLLAVGAAFDFHAGNLPQAPRWMQRAGLEWAFRLAHEPRRLLPRYARSNPRYLLRLSQEVLRGSRGRDASTTLDVQTARARPCPG